MSNDFTPDDNRLGLLHLAVGLVPWLIAELILGSIGAGIAYLCHVAFASWWIEYGQFVAGAGMALLIGGIVLACIEIYEDDYRFRTYVMCMCISLLGAFICGFWIGMWKSM